MRKRKVTSFIVISVLILTVLITTVFATGSRLKGDGEDGYTLDTSNVKFTEEYTYFDYYLESIPEDDRVATVNTEVSDALLAIRYDEKGKAISFNELSVEEKLERVSEAKANLEIKYCEPVNEIDVAMFPVEKEIDALIIELVELEIDLEHNISEKTNSDIEKMISEVYIELEILYVAEYELLEKYDLLEEEYED